MMMKPGRVNRLPGWQIITFLITSAVAGFLGGYVLAVLLSPSQADIAVQETPTTSLPPPLTTPTSEPLPPPTVLPDPPYPSTMNGFRPEQTAAPLGLQRSPDEWTRASGVHPGKTLVTAPRL